MYIQVADEIRLQENGAVVADGIPSHSGLRLVALLNTLTATSNFMDACLKKSISQTDTLIDMNKALIRDLECVTAELNVTREELNTWKRVFGHLGATADEAGNTIYSSSDLRLAHPRPGTLMDGWTTWRGGDNPVSDEAMVSVLFRDGETEDHCQAGVYRWIHLDSAYDIVAYKVQA